MFRSSVLFHPEATDEQGLDGGSHFGASRAGPAYVLAKGFPARDLVALLGSCAIAALAALGLVALFFDAAITTAPSSWCFLLLRLQFKDLSQSNWSAAGVARRRVRETRRSHHRGPAGREASSRILGSVLAAARGSAVA
jgi:hypothetical protein